MQVFIFAAGKGSRIAKYSKKRPKPLLEINGESLLLRQVRLLRSLGLKDITVVVGYKHELILDELKGYDIKYIYNPFYEVVNLIGSFWLTLEHLKDDFMHIHGDVICDKEVIERLANSKGDIVLGVQKIKCGEEEMKVVIKDGYVLEVSKMISPEKAYGEVLGLAKTSKKMIPIVKRFTEKLIAENKFNLFYEGVAQEIINKKSGRVGVCDMAGLRCIEIDFEKDYKKAIKMFKI